MKLKDIISTGLLPRFAKDSAWCQAALDTWVRSAVGKFAALGVPFTFEAVKALTDEELQELYKQYNIVEYYPDLSRTTRELMIYNISKLRRRLGTKAAVVALVQYVFDGLNLSVDIYDNLAFNETGELIDASLIDVYDVEITLSDAVLTDEIRKRLLNNIFRLVPDRLGLRNIIFTYPANYVKEQQIFVADLETVVENDAVCVPITQSLPTVSLSGDFGAYNWLRVNNGAESISAGGSSTNLTADGTTFPLYDSLKSYAVVQWQASGGTTAGRTEFGIVNASGYFQAHNNTENTLTFYQAKVAVCSSNEATVVTVYDANNIAYNAFKYTLNGTDYYFILDGVQEDWTDDLGGIGFETFEHRL